MSIINFSNTRQMEGLLDEISQVKDLIESKINLSRVADREKRVSLTLNKVMRICFIVGLSVTVERKEDDFKDIQLSTSSGSHCAKFLHNARFVHIIFSLVETSLCQSEYRLVTECHSFTYHCSRNVARKKLLVGREQSGFVPICSKQQSGNGKRHSGAQSNYR